MPAQPAPVCVIDQAAFRVTISLGHRKEVPVTHFPAEMLEELQRRNYSHRAAKACIRIVREFAEYFHCSASKAGPGHIRQYQTHLFHTKKLAPATVS